MFLRYDRCQLNHDDNNIINRYKFEVICINSSSFKTAIRDATNDGNGISKTSMRIRSVSTSRRPKPMVTNYFCYFYIHILLYFGDFFYSYTSEVWTTPLQTITMP